MAEYSRSDTDTSEPAEYAQFEDLVGELKRSAVDARVRGRLLRRGDIPHTLVETEDSRYLISLGEDTKPFYALTRPGANGKGGGVWSSAVSGKETDGPAELAADLNSSTFGDLQSTIDGIVDRWRGLPKPQRIMRVVECCNEATRNISVTTTDDGKVIRGGGPIVGPLESIGQNCSSMAGTTIGDFKDLFINQLAVTISGYSAISSVRSRAAIAEHGLWEGAEAQVVTILQEGKKAFDKLGFPHSGDVDWSEILQVVGWVTTALAAFTIEVPLVSAGFALISLGTTIADTCKSEAPVKKTVKNYQDTVEALEEMFDALNDQVTSVENAIKLNLSENYDSITGGQGSFDLIPVSFRSDSEVIIINEALVDDIVNVHMRRIAEILEETAHMSNQGKLGSILERDPAVGMSASGPSSTIDSFADLLERLLGELAWEARAEARNLELAVDYHFEHEAQVAQELNDLADQVEQGSDYHPWDVELASGARTQAPILNNLDDVLGG